MGRTERFPAAEVATNQVADSILEGVPYPVEAALGWNCNFNMSAPAAWKWDEALRKVPYYVHISPFASEMAAHADLLLPSSTFLEQWGYDHCPPGSGFAEARLKQPVVDPLPHSKCPGEIVFELARLQGERSPNPFRTSEEISRDLSAPGPKPFCPGKTSVRRACGWGPLINTINTTAYS